MASERFPCDRCKQPTAHQSGICAQCRKRPCMKCGEQVQFQGALNQRLICNACDKKDRYRARRNTGKGLDE